MTDTVPAHAPPDQVELGGLRAGAPLGQDGRYVLQRLIGAGGMASVWLAEDRRVGTTAGARAGTVALKILADSMSLDAAAVARFEREARLVSTLRHRCLARVLDHGVSAGRPYLAMEYLPGGTLAQRLRDPDTAGIDVVALAGDLLDALRYIHGLGVLHRDIKPGNVLLAGDGRWRLTDFGIATTAAAVALTGSDVAMGTRRYSAPEVQRGSVADERSDLYSCGVVLSECLAAGAPAALRALVGALTATDPSWRPRSAALALAALRSGSARE